MLTAIEIENFKGIGDRQRIELAPITLLFGPNSAGKSSVLHALHYFREAVLNQDLDPRPTAASDPPLDFGGFRNLVFNGDELAIQLRLELRTKGDLDYVTSLPPPRPRQLMLEMARSVLSGEPKNIVDPEAIPTRLLLEARLPLYSFLRNYIENLAVTLTVAWNARLERPVCRRFQIEFNGEEVVRLENTPDLKNSTIFVNASAAPFRVDTESAAGFLERLKDIMERAGGLPGERKMGTSDRLLSEILPPAEPETSLEPEVWSAALAWLDDDTGPQSGVPGPLGPRALTEDSEVWDEEETLAAEIRAQVVTDCFEVAHRRLRELLAEPIHVGPIRAVPTRNFSSRAATTWYDGLAAWKHLADEEADHRERVNQWLREDPAGDSRFEVVETLRIPSNDPVLHRIRAVPDDIDTDLALWLEELQSEQSLALVLDASGMQLSLQDVGVGISQAVPAIVAALLSPEGHLTLIEQPELHLHPRLQLGLGNFFAEAAVSGGQMIVETHSEHVILRLSSLLGHERSGLTPETIAVSFFWKDDGTVRAKRIGLDREGEFTDEWPQGFFPERRAELRRLLK